VNDKVSVAEIHLWGSLVGYVSWNEETEVASFEYDQDFLHRAPVEVSPIKVPRKQGVFSFPELKKETFYGLPGMLADSLPDKFGNALIDVWLSTKGRKPGSFNPIERLCYVGDRGMGALEFKPATYKGRLSNVPIEIEDMVRLSSAVLANKEKLKENLKHEDKKKLKEALTNLLVVGTSAGGARAKCIIAYNEKSGEVRSGQLKTTKDFSYWLLKLDGVSNNRDKELIDPQGFGRIEYAYYLMAKDCEIIMSDSRLVEENGRAHFMTKRFDRLEGGEKIHMQSLCALGHFDFNMAGAYSYEQALEMIRMLVKSGTKDALEQQFKRAVFNVIGRNQDDHTKNIAFLMDRSGSWQLSPAFDMAYSYNPSGAWTSKHQMSLNGKRDAFAVEDLIAFGTRADLKKIKDLKIIKDIGSVFSKWTDYAEKAGVFEHHQKIIPRSFRHEVCVK
jgi:serine/threonine-protein kinase HipA